MEADPAAGEIVAPPAPPSASRMVISLARETLDGTDVPATRLHFVVTRGTRTDEYDLGPIPECCETVITHGDDVATFEGWYAGGGHRLRLRREGDAVVVYQVLFGEGMGVPTTCDIRGDELLRIPVEGELTLEAPPATERLAALPDCTPAELAALVEEEGG